MGESQSDQEPETDDEGAPVLPDLNPWREVGWIFRDGDCIAIERQTEAPDTGVLVD